MHHQALMGVLQFVVRRTRLGAAMRAVAENERAARVLGIDVERWQPADLGKLGRRDVELERMGQRDAALAEVDLDRRQARAVDDGRALAGLAVDERDRAQRARAVQELPQLT